MNNYQLICESLFSKVGRNKRQSRFVTAGGALIGGTSAYIHNRQMINLLKSQYEHEVDPDKKSIILDKIKKYQSISNVSTRVAGGAVAGGLIGKTASVIDNKMTKRIRAQRIKDIRTKKARRERRNRWESDILGFNTQEH